MPDLVILDDSEQKKSARKGLRGVRAVGGLLIPSASVGSLESQIHELKSAAGFPVEPHDGEVKWSPGKDQWMHGSLRQVARTNFQTRLVDALVAAGCEAFVACHSGGVDWAVVWESGIRMAHEVLRERGTSGVVVTDRPSDGSEKTLQGICFGATNKVSIHPRAMGVAISPATVDSAYVGLMQSADLVVGATLGAIVMKGYEWELVFRQVKRLMLSPRRDIPRGGRRLLLEPPDLSNLYYWLLEDEILIRGATELPLPSASMPYYESPDEP